MFCRHLLREHGMHRALRGCQTISSRTLSDTPTVLNQTISSVTEVTTLSGDIASVTSDIATSLPVSQISSVAEVVKVAVEQLPDLVGYNPTSYVIHGLDLLQTTTGLPWWATLVCCGVVSRTAMLPINIYAQRIRMKFLPVADQFKKNGDAIQAAHKSKDLLKIKILSKEKKYLKAKYGVGPFSMMKPLIGIGACTMTIFFSITKLTSMPYAPLLNTDFLWLSNLTLCDPYHAMAAFNGMLVAVLIKSGIDTGKSPIIDMFFSTPLRTISFITFMGVTQGYFSSALLTYWISSNLVGMLTVQLLKWERFRASVGLLPLKEMRVLEDKQPTLEQLMNDVSGEL